MIDLRLITFITVAKTKNFTRAAEILNISQPAVYQQIQYLEAYYGVKFITKEGRDLNLTEEGKVFLQYAKEMAAMSNEMEERLKNQSSIRRRRHIGATMTIGGYVLPEILGKYKSINDNENIILEVDNTDVILTKLLDKEIQLALVEGPFDRMKFKYRKFKDDELVLAVSSKHDFAKKEKVDIKEVLKGNLILREQGSGTRKIFENELMQRGHNPDAINLYMEVGNINAIVSLVEANVGYTIISREAVKKEVRQGSIIIVPVNEFKMNREFNFVYLYEREMDFINYFVEFCCGYNREN